MIINTKDGLEIDVDGDAFDNMEVLDAMRGMTDDDPLALSTFCDLVFSKDEKKKLYDFCRDDNGKVPLAKVISLVTEIISLINQPAKN